MRDPARVRAVGKRFFPILLCLDSLGCSSLCLRACLLRPDSPASATPLSRLKCHHHYHPPCSHRYPTVGTQRSHQNTHRRLLPPWRFSPPAGATHLAELYRQPGRPHQEGRSTRTPHATSGTCYYRATALASSARLTRRRGETCTCRWTWNSRCIIFHARHRDRENHRTLRDKMTW
jgi:hypothetical protein